MARNLNASKRREIKSRRLSIFPRHQRRLPEQYRTIEHTLVDAGEGRIEERALILPFAIGWPSETMTAKIMRHVEAFREAQRIISAREYLRSIDPARLPAS